MYVFAKRSGESLNVDDPSSRWTTQGRDSTVAELGRLSAYVREPNDQGVRGVAIVVGAGNLALRGRELVRCGIESDVADEMGMVGTIWNARRIARDLDRAGIAHRLLLASGIRYSIPGVEEMEECTVGAMQKAFDGHELVVIGGGYATPGQTTDAAILQHALDYRGTGERVRVLKGTKYPGVFDADPAEYDDARLLSRVSADVMLDRGWSAVDEVCLGTITKRGIEMLVHAADVPILDALGGEGTLIVPGPNVLEYANSAAA